MNDCGLNYRPKLKNHDFRKKFSRKRSANSIYRPSLNDNTLCSGLPLEMISCRRTSPEIIPSVPPPAPRHPDNYNACAHRQVCQYPGRILHEQLHEDQKKPTNDKKNGLSELLPILPCAGYPQKVPFQHPLGKRNPVRKDA